MLHYGNYCGPGPTLLVGCRAPFDAVDHVDATCMRHDLDWCKCYARAAAGAGGDPWRGLAKVSLGGGGSSSSKSLNGSSSSSSATTSAEKRKQHRQRHRRARRARRAQQKKKRSRQRGGRNGMPLGMKPSPLMLSTRFLTLPGPLYRRLFDRDFRECIRRADLSLVTAFDFMIAAASLNMTGFTNSHTHTHTQY